MELPIVKLTQEEFEANKVEIESLELVELVSTQLLISQDGTAMNFNCEGSDYLYFVNDFEATVLSFFATGLHDKGHIPTIYELFKRTMEDLSMKLEKAVVEGKDGDVMYARLVWRDRHHRVLTTPCTVVDAVVHSIQWKVPLLIVRAALEGFDRTDEWEFFDDTEDYTLDDQTD